MGQLDTPHATLRALIADVARYLVHLAVSAVRDLVRVPLAVIKALLGLLSAKGRAARLLLIRLLLDAAWDLLLLPLILAAAGLDILLSPVRPPALFYGLRRFEMRCERLLDHWFEAALHVRPRSARVEDVLAGFGEAVSDPDRSERRARAMQRRAKRKRAAPHS